MIITAQLPVSKWYEHINDPTLADAIMDGLLANSIKNRIKRKLKKNKKLTTLATSLSSFIYCPTNGWVNMTGMMGEHDRNIHPTS